MNRSRDRLAHQFSLEPQQIARVVHAAARGESADLANALWSRAAQQSRPRLEGLATRIEPAAEWSDLVVPPAIDDALLAGLTPPRMRLYVVRVGETAVEVGDDFEDDTLARVVRVLRAC